MFWSSGLWHYAVWETINDVSKYTASNFRVTDMCNMFVSYNGNHLPDWLYGDVTQKITE